MIDASPAVTLEDAAVKLRRLGAYVEGGQPARLLAGALGVLERAAAETKPRPAEPPKEKPRPEAGAKKAPANT